MVECFTGGCGSSVGIKHTSQAYSPHQNNVIKFHVIIGLEKMLCFQVMACEIFCLGFLLQE